MSSEEEKIKENEQLQTYKPHTLFFCISLLVFRYFPFTRSQLFLTRVAHFIVPLEIGSLLIFHLTKISTDHSITAEKIHGGTGLFKGRWRLSHVPLSFLISLLYFLEELMSVFLRLNAQLFRPILWFPFRKQTMCQSFRWTSVGEGCDATTELSFWKVGPSPRKREGGRRGNGHSSLPYDSQRRENQQITLTQDWSVFPILLPV